MPIRMLVMVRRKAGLTAKEFRDGYENSHSRIAVELFGHLWLSYRRNYFSEGRCFDSNLLAGEAATADHIGFDAISEFVLPDEDALAEMNRISLANYPRIKDDEARWFDQVNSWLFRVDTVEEDLAIRKNHVDPTMS